MDTAERMRRYQLLRTQAKAERDNWQPIWKACADYILPRRMRGLNESPSSATNRGDPFNDKIIDNEAGFSLRTFAAGISSMMTNPARPWFRLQPSDTELAKLQSVKVYCDQVRDIIATTLKKSNCYQVLPTSYMDLGCFGTAGIYEDEDPTDVVRFYSLPIGTYALACDKGGRVDTLIREYSMTIRQMVDEFGIDAVSVSVRDLYKNGDLEQKRDVVHIITPNSIWDDRKLDSKYKRWASCHYESGSAKPDAGMPQMFLRESGYDEFPAFCPRWSTVGEDIYGSSPGMDALPDSQQLQQLERRKLQAIDKNVNPPLQVPADSNIDSVNMLPGGINFVDNDPSGKGIRRLYEFNFDISGVTEDAQEVRARIQRAFYADLWLLISQIERTGVTATEIQAKQDEKLQQLGTAVDRIDNELLSPLIERTYSILLRRGLLPDPPEEMRGVELKIDYVSTIAQALKLASASGIGRFIAFIGNLAQSRPDIGDKVNFDEAVDIAADVMAVPASMIRGNDEANAIRMARAKASQQAQQATNLQQVAKGAQLLSQTQLNTGSALDALIQSGA